MYLIFYVLLLLILKTNKTFPISANVINGRESIHPVVNLSGVRVSEAITNYFFARCFRNDFFDLLVASNFLIISLTQSIKKFDVPYEQNFIFAAAGNEPVDSAECYPSSFRAHTHTFLPRLSLWPRKQQLRWPTSLIIWKRDPSFACNFLSLQSF